MRGSSSVNQPLVRGVVNWLLAGSGSSRRPRIMEDPLPAFPESAELIARFDELRDEVGRLVGERDLAPYGDVDPTRAAQVSVGRRLSYACMLGVSDERAHRDLPMVIDFAERTPRVGNAMVAQLPPGVTLDRTFRTWAEGRPIPIDDTFEHEVHDTSSGTARSATRPSSRRCSAGWPQR